MSLPRPMQALACLAAVLSLILPPLHAALASQGPGGGPGTAGAVTQTMMAIAVYGGAALIIAAALIGSLKRRF